MSAVDSYQGYWLGCLGVQYHEVTLFELALATNCKLVSEHWICSFGGIGWGLHIVV